MQNVVARYICPGSYFTFSTAVQSSGVECQSTSPPSAILSEGKRQYKQDVACLDAKVSDTRPAKHEGFLSDSTNHRAQHSATDTLAQKPQMKATRNAPPPPAPNLQRHANGAAVKNENSAERRAVMPLLDTAAARSVIIAAEPRSPSLARSPPASASSGAVLEGSPSELNFGGSPMSLPSDLLVTVSRAKENIVGSRSAANALRSQLEKPSAAAGRQPHQRVQAVYPGAPSYAFYSQAVFMHPQGGMYDDDGVSGKGGREREGGKKGRERE